MGCPSQESLPPSFAAPDSTTLKFEVGGLQLQELGDILIG
jgi:hypothetical protein